MGLISLSQQIKMDDQRRSSLELYRSVNDVIRLLRKRLMLLSNLSASGPGHQFNLVPGQSSVSFMHGIRRKKRTKNEKCSVRNWNFSPSNPILFIDRGEKIEPSMAHFAAFVLHVTNSQTCKHCMKPCHPATTRLMHLVFEESPTLFRR